MASKKCAVDGCGKHAWARGYCTMHYRRVVKTGSPGDAVSVRGKQVCPVCGRKAFAKGYCKKHYCRIVKTGDPSPAKIKRAVTFEKQCKRCGKPFVTKRESQMFCCRRCSRFKHEGPCKVEGCGRKHWAHGYCSMHGKRVRESGEPGIAEPKRTPGGKTCKVDGCDRRSRVFGFCEMHHARFKKTGDPGPAHRMIGCGHGCVTKQGYRVLSRPGHPNAFRRGQILEHTLVMSETLGRPLHKGETVHHRNGDRADNRPENLELWVTTQPSGQRVTDRISDAIHLLQKYATDKSLWPEGTDQLQRSFRRVNV